jgi:hypothetical protein
MTGLKAGAACSTVSNHNLRRFMILSDPVEGAKVGRLSNTVSDGTTNYHGLLLSLQRRAASGVNINTNYTWSHCISPEDGNGFGGTGFNSNSGYADWNNRDRTRGNCDQDRRHSLNLTVVASTPEFSNDALRYVASDWTFSTIYRVNSGSYMTVTPGISDVDRNGQSGDIASYIGGDVYTGTEGPDALYINTASFVNPAIGSFGNLGYNNIKGPYQWDFDVSLRRTFALGETQELEFRAEAYNLTNSFRAGNPNTTIGNRFFGITRGQNSDDPRIMQFALKLNF